VAEHGAVRSLADHLSLRERIVARLRQAIITGELAQKSRLIEPELARQLNVSRTPLREAIRQLEAEGFVTNVPRFGSFVSEITPRDVEDLYAIRTVIEGLAARQAAENPDPAKRDVLDNILADLAKRTGDYRQYHEISGRFHDIIVELSENRRLQGIYHSLAQHVSRMRTLSLAVRGRPEISLRGHRRIATAILRGRGVEAERAMRAHIEAAYGVLKRTVRKAASRPAAGSAREALPTQRRAG
jgi:DNA-binding GntR family transcriptional regulator